MLLLHAESCRKLLLALLLMLIGAVAQAQPALVTPPQQPEPNLLLEVRLNQDLLSEGITAYQVDDRIYLPLGELARLLSIAIQAEPEQGTASGFILREERSFSLNVNLASFAIGQQRGNFDPALVRAEADDIYVASALLAEWLPLDLDVELSTLTLHINPREQLPLQARMERERRAKQLELESAQEDPRYPRLRLPYRLLDLPFIDQTLSMDVRREGGTTRVDGTYTAYLTGDLLGMESSLFFSRNFLRRANDIRFTLARHDPYGELLGPLHARSLEIGSITTPPVPNISVGAGPGSIAGADSVSGTIPATGTGIAPITGTATGTSFLPSGTGLRLSNRPLAQPASFDRHSLQGDLPPGWDVELYFNGALVGFQLANAEGRYRFDDLPLVFGPNEFRLVFHGPLGQIRVERHFFLLEQALTRPGEFHYTLAEQRDQAGRRRSVMQFNAGVNRHLTLNAGIAILPVAGIEQQYASAGLHSFWQSYIFSGDFAWSDNGGRLAQLGLKTRARQLSFNLSHALLQNFSSEVFQPSSDLVRARSQLNINGTLPGLPVLPLAFTVKHDQRQSGRENTEVGLRLSTFIKRTALSNTFNWQKTETSETVIGLFQMSRRVAGISFTSQVNYTLQPVSAVTSAALTADRPLSAGYRLNLGVTRRFPSLETRYSLGLTKIAGRFGLGLRTTHASTGENTVGVQLFVALGREPRQGRWRFDAQPMANSGAASAQVFLDQNMNGVRDAGDQPIRGAKLSVSGAGQPARTNEDGIAFLRHLPIRRSIDIAVDTSSLEDPQWAPQKQGVRVVPRAGRVAEIDIPVILTAEIDGTVYVQKQNVRRGIGDAVVELLDADGKVAAQARTAVDGYYVLPFVPPGEYQLQVSPRQLERLGLESSDSYTVTILPDGEFVSGKDFVLMPEE